MSPCAPLNVSMPDTSPNPIPGFGMPSSLKTPKLAELPEDFPEDLIELFQKLKLLIPPGALKPQLSLNFAKDLFDGIMDLMDKIVPWLMLYKFFLPILNLIICIIEVLCAIPNPVKLVKALTKLFRDCIPQFLSLFPILALILLIISLILLVIALIKYIYNQIKKLIKLLIKNIKMFIKAVETLNEQAGLAVLKKIGDVLCIFQNILVLLAIFTTIFQSIKEMLSLIFALPPCDDDAACCTTDVCPAIVKSEYTRQTGTFKYLNQVINTTDIGFIILKDTERSESWQLFDPSQLITQKFVNIIDAFDVPIIPPARRKPVFFPTDTFYSKETDPQQAAYTVDLRLFYNPQSWGRTGVSRYVRIKDCVVLNAPSLYYKSFNPNERIPFENGVLNLAGGVAYEDDGETLIPGFEYGLNSFLHTDAVEMPTPVFNSNDGYTFDNIEYTFKPNIPTLLSKNLITLGCSPEVAFAKTFVNNAFAGDISLKLQLANEVQLPDTSGAQECLTAALNTLRSNVTLDGVAEFEANCNLCLDKLEKECFTSLCELIIIACDPCKSTFSISPATQFTTQSIKISIDLKERSGTSLTTGIPDEVAQCLIEKIKAHATFGEVSEFVYDGSQFFTAFITSKDPGAGTLMISFDNNIFCTNNIPEDATIAPSRELQEINYEFIYSPAAIPVAEGDTSDGTQPRRDNLPDGTREGV